MKRITTFSPIILAAALCACGGGGSDSAAPQAAALAPVPVPAAVPSPTSTSTAAPAPEATPNPGVPPPPEGMSFPPPEPAASAAPDPAASAATAPAADRTCGFINFQDELLVRINQARAMPRNCGDAAFPAVAPLAWNDRLSDASIAHAFDMARNNYFAHDSLDGRLFSQRIDAAGYAWSAAGENIAAGQDSVEQAVAEWLASPGHCANIMNPDFSEIGVACVRADDGADYPYYWAMELGLPR